MLIEDFQNNVPEDIRIYTSEKKGERMHELVVMAGGYALTYKRRRQGPLPPPKLWKIENLSSSGRFGGSCPEPSKRPVFA